MFIRLLIASLILSFSSLSAHADWVEARSENFIFKGDASEQRAKLIVNDLEDYRKILFTFLKLDGDQAETVPVQVYGIKSGGLFRKIIKGAGYSNAAGIYKDTREGPVFMLDVSGSFSKNSQARAIAYHEYAHHIVSTYSNLVYPRWYNEGYAEYLSTFHIDKKGVVSIGLPHENRGLTLAYANSRATWLDMDTLTGAIRHYPGKGQTRSKRKKTQALFYAQSWLAVHYLFSEAEYADKVGGYLKAINQPDAPDNVFETSFGISPDEFGKLLRKYHAKNKYKGFAITLTDNDRKHNIDVKKLTSAEGQFHRAEAIRRFVHGDEARLLSEKYYNNAIDAGYPSAPIHASRALIALAQGDETMALAHIEKALNQEKLDSRILQIAGYVYLRQYKDKKTASDISQIKTARKYLKQALKANSRNMEAHFNYVSTYAAANDLASKQAIYSAEECAYHFKGNNFINSNLSLADVLIRNNKGEAARPILEKAAIWSASAPIRTKAKLTLEKLP